MAHTFSPVGCFHWEYFISEIIALLSESGGKKFKLHVDSSASSNGEQGCFRLILCLDSKTSWIKFFLKNCFWKHTKAEGSKNVWGCNPEKKKNANTCA